MASYDEKIKEFEEEIKKTQYNKATQHHIGLIKAKIAKLREKAEAGSKKSAGKGYSVKKSGDATVIMVGYPSVGKSTLLNALTDADSEVGSYDFTTLDVIPGLLEYEGARIQVLDVPGVVKGAASGTGRGKEVLSVMRSADLVMIIVDVNHPGHYDLLMKEIRDAGLRINEEKPDVKITKKARGGLSIASTVKLTKVNKETIKAVLNEFRIVNADVVIRSNITIDQLIDSIEANKIYLPGIAVLNKVDLISEKKLSELNKKFRDSINVSAKNNTNIDKLKGAIFSKLDLIRIYCKQAGKEADLNVPLIMKKNATVEDMCIKLHRDFITKFKFVRIWGKSAKFPGQSFLNLKHRLEDKDVVELHMR